MSDRTLVLTADEARMVDAMFAYMHSSDEMEVSVEGLSEGAPEVVFEFYDVAGETTDRRVFDGQAWDALNTKVTAFVEGQ